MAVFNPQVPNPSDPDYLRASKGISNIETDKSSAIAIKGIGDLFESGIKATDQVISMNVEDEAYKASKAEQDKHRQEMDVMGEIVEGKKPLNILDQGADPNATPPKGISDFEKRVATMSNARDNGKLTETKYLGDLVKLGKEFNTRYPGYRDVIKTAMHKATGIDNVDEAYIKSRMGDINSSLTAIKGEKDKQEAFVRQHMDDTPGLPTVADSWRRGESDFGSVEKFVNTFHGRRAQLTVSALERAEREGGRKDAGELASEDLVNNGYNIANSHLSSATVSLGVGTPQKVTDVLRRASTGDLNISPETAEGMAGLMASTKEQAHASIIKWANENKRPGSDKTYAQELGPTALSTQASSIVDSTIKPVLDLITNKEYGEATRTARAIDAINNSTTLYLTNKGDHIARYLRLSAAFRKQGGEQFAGELAKRGIMDGLPGEIKTLMDEKSALWATQPKFSTTGNPNDVATVKETLDDLDMKGLGTEKTHAAVWNMVDVASDPKTNDQTRDGYLRAIFSPKGQGVLSRYAVDGQDKDGNPITGRYYMFRRLTDTDMVNAVWKSSPDIKKQYLDFVGTSLTKDLIGKDLQDMSAFSKNPGVNVFFNTESRVPFFETRFEKRPDQGAFAPDVNTSQAKFLKGFTDRINTILPSLTYIYEKTGADPATELLKTFMNTGIDVTDVKGLPNAIVESIANNKKAAEEVSPEGNKKKFQSIQEKYNPGQSNFAPKEDKITPEAQKAIDDVIRVRRPKSGSISSEGNVVSYGDWEDVKPNDFFNDVNGNKYIMRGGKFYKASSSNGQ